MARLIYIVRHGNTFDKGDVVTRVGGRTDLDLSVSGRAQAEALAIHFKGKVTGFSNAYCSPLTRTRQTAEAILKVHSNAPALETLEFLREVDYGPDENKPEGDVVARIGEAALKAWETDAVPPNGWIIDPARLIEDWKALFDRLSAEQTTDPVLLVTSNGIARFALSACAHSGEHDLKLKTGAYGVIRLHPDQTPELVDWNIRP